jgi:hypothetical protein
MGQLTASKQARKLAGERLAAVAKGADPSAERHASRTAPTVSDLAERFVAEHVDSKLKPSTAETVRLALKNHILPGPRPAAGSRLVTPADVADLHHSMRKTPGRRRIQHAGLPFENVSRWQSAGACAPTIPRAAWSATGHGKRESGLLSAAELAQLRAPCWQPPRLTAA